MPIVNDKPASWLPQNKKTMGRKRANQLPEYVAKKLDEAPNDGAEYAIRAKERSNGRYVLYLDHYLGKINGKAKHEYIYFNTSTEGKGDYYLIPEKTKADKIHNNNVWQQVLINQSTLNNASKEERMELKKTKSKIDFFQFLNDLIEEEEINPKEEKRKKSSIVHPIKQLVTHLKEYTGRDILLFEDLDEDFLMGFTQYLRHKARRKYHFYDIEKIANEHSANVSKPLSQTTQSYIQSTLKRLLDEAVRKKYINGNPFRFLGKEYKISINSEEIAYLEKEEVQKLIDTPMPNCGWIKQMFLFCCMTGLRFSDATTMKWGDIVHTEAGWELRKRIVKTDRLEEFPLSNAAMKFLPERGDDGDVIFNYKHSTWMSEKLQEWVKSAGINKKVRFHVSRHTAGTLNLTLGTPIETVSKLLGHKSIATTQIYAKVVKAKERKAVELQEGVFKI